MKRIIFYLLAIVLLSCHSKVKDNNPKTTKAEQKDPNNKCRVPAGDISSRCFTDTVIIWVHPTDKEDDSLHKAMGNEYYDSMEQDAGMYNTDAQSFLVDKPITEYYMISDSAKTYSFKTKKGLVVINKDKYVSEWVCPWLIILFNGKDEPVVTAPVNLEETFNNYFK